ncbi:MAG: kinase [Verrucomicrobiota bacterium]
MIISRTPFRVSFFGGGTDFPDYYREYGGATLLTTINKFCYISIHKLSPFFKHRFRASYSKTETVQEPSEFTHPLIRECLKYLQPRYGLEIAHVSDLPGRTGLGTSSAFTVGLLHALHGLAGNRVAAEDLAREAILIEREKVGDAGGHQDQYAAAYGGLLRLDFLPTAYVSVKKLALRAERILDIERHLMLLFTGVEQSAEQILAVQKRRTRQNTGTLRAMQRMVDEAETILCGTGTLDAFGDLLHESWQLKKTLSDGISNTLVDDMYTAARAVGARGGKLLGAGGRGFMLLFVDPDKQPAVQAKLKGLFPVPFAFEPAGSQIIFNEPDNAGS